MISHLATNYQKKTIHKKSSKWNCFALGSTKRNRAVLSVALVCDRVFNFSQSTSSNAYN